VSDRTGNLLPDLNLNVIMGHIRCLPAIFPAFFHHTVLTGAEFASNPVFPERR
jgi:hypothetical protein